MAIYYIDYENVHNAGLHGVETLTENDCVHIFYKDSDTMQLPVVKCLLESKASVRFERVRRTTLNALDFQLLAELFCSADREYENYIISHDKGYDSAIDVARAHGISLQRKEAIDAPDFLRPQLRMQKPEATEEAEVVPEEAEPEVEDNVPAVQEEAAAEPAEIPEQAAAPVMDEAALAENMHEAESAESAAPVAEPAESIEAPVQKMEGPSRRTSRRSRGGRRRTAASRTGEATPAAEAEPAAQQPAEAVSDQSADESAAPVEITVITPEEDAARIAAVVLKNNIATVGEADYSMIAEAVRNSDNKNRFYQYFVKALGADKGQQFYRGIKSYYLKFVDALK